MPLAVAIPGTILCAVQVLQEVRGRSVPVSDEDEVEEDTISAEPLGVRRRGALLQLAGVGVCIALIWLVGFRLAAAVWVLAFMLTVARTRWLRALGYTAVVVVGIELLAAVLSVRLPGGMLR
jgi:Flp pilus assembly protein TadB